MERLFCRLCRKPLSGDEGCAVCSTIKNNMVCEDDGETESLASVAGETVRLMKSQLRQLQAKQTRSPEYDPKLASETRAHAGALARVLEAARKVIQDGVDAVDAMSLKEKAELLVEWFVSLPPTYRRKIHAELSAHTTELDRTRSEKLSLDGN